MKFEVYKVVTVRNGFLGCGLMLSGTHLAMFPTNFLHQISGHGYITNLSHVSYMPRLFQALLLHHPNC